MNKKIAILGSESFLAQNFVTYLKMNGLISKFELIMYDYSEKSVYSKQFNYTKINFNDVSSVSKIDFNVDTIIIFIGKTGTLNGFKEYESFIRINEVMLLNILHGYTKQNSSARIVYPSTRLIYKSNNYGTVTEDSEKEFRSIYAVTKYAAEQYLKIYSEIFNIEYVILRICTPIGSLLKEDGSYGTFEIFRHQAKKNKQISIYGDGNQKKTFTNIQDVSRAIYILITSNQILWNQYNLGGYNYSLREIANEIAKEYYVPINYIEWPYLDKKVDGGTTVFDSERFDKEFDFEYTPLMKKEE